MERMEQPRSIEHCDAKNSLCLLDLVSNKVDTVAEKPNQALAELNKDSDGKKFVQVWDKLLTTGKIDDNFVDTVKSLAQKCQNEPSLLRALQKEMQDSDIEMSLDKDGVSFSKIQSLGRWGGNAYSLRIPFDGTEPTAQIRQQAGCMPPEAPRPISSDEAAKDIFQPHFESTESLFAKMRLQY